MSHCQRLIKLREYEVRRPKNPGEYGEDGFPKPEIEKVFNIKGNDQAISGRERLLVPEGDRNRDVRDLFTDSKLNRDDIVIVDGDEFEVRTVEDWTLLRRTSHRVARIVMKDTR